MKKYPCKVIALCLIALVAYFQSPAQKPSAPVKIEAKSDTVIVRLNNKLYYSITDNGRWRISEEGKVIFSPLNASDTIPALALEYISSKPLLGKKLLKSDTIKNCLIGEIKLSPSDFTDKTQKKNAAQNVCSRKLIFVNCVFNRILADTNQDILDDDSKMKKKILFTQDVLFFNCNFVKGLELSDCIFQKTFILTGLITSSSPSSIDNCEFQGLCYIYSTPDYNKGNSYLKMSSCVSNNPCNFSVVDNDKTHITIERCKFRNLFSLGKSIPQNIFKRFRSSPVKNHELRLYNYYTAYANFLKTKFSKEYYLSSDSIQAFLPVSHIIYNVVFLHCQAKIMDIANASMMNCSMEDVTILKCMDVTGSNFTYSTDFTGKQALEDIDMPNINGIIYASYKTFSPDAFKLNIYLQKVMIHPLVHNYFDSTTDFVQDNTNFYNMIKDYSAKKFTNQDMVTSLKARFEHERAYWERNYHAEHIIHSDGFGDFISSFFQWSLSLFLEATVSNGYKGEWKFALWVLFLIFLFTCIYYFKHKEAAIDYLNAKYNKEEEHIQSYDTLTVHRSFNGFRDFIRCLWFSCMVFVDPRLPISFFNLRTGLFGLVLTEWLCGLTAIALFVIFLASNYPFIHTLIGI